MNGFTQGGINSRNKSRAVSTQAGPISAVHRRDPGRFRRVESRPSLSRGMSVRGAWQLSQLRFERIEIDRLGQEIGSPEFAGAAAALVRALRPRFSESLWDVLPVQSFCTL